MVLENPTVYSNSILSGKHWSQQANKPYVMPANVYHQAFDGGDVATFGPIVAKFVEKHASFDAPRITKLQRYYLGDNDIHYWHNDKKLMNRADNRIASGFAKFITNMRVGYMLGKPIQFRHDNDDEDDSITDELDDFNKQNDETYHEKVMKTNLSVTGRAYELLYVDSEAPQDDEGNYGTPDVKMRAIDPATAFVVYDTSIDRHSLFGVRYYMVDYNDTQTYYVDVYTADTTYHLQSDTTNAADADYTLLDKETTNFGAVPLTEFDNNENRTGDWESKLDEIDAYDLAMSEMANSEEDFANAKLAINGDIDFSDNQEELKDRTGKTVLDDDGNPVMVPKVDTKDPYIMLKPSVIPDPSGGNTVINSSAEYLTKQLNESGWQIYINQLITDIHKDTNTPNTTDEAFSGQSSGVALMYKLFGEDQERSMQESLYTRGIRRRLRLLGAYWQHNRELSDATVMNDYVPTYTPNLPRNNSDIVNMVVQLNNTGLLSDQTLREIISTVTNVSADVEEQRVDDEKDDDADTNSFAFNGAPLQGANPADVAEARRQIQQEQGSQAQQPKTAADLIANLQRGSDSDAKS